MSDEFDVKISGGNVFTDLHLAALEEAPAKAELARRIDSRAGGLVPASG